MFEKIIGHAFEPATPAFRTAIISLSGGLPPDTTRPPQLEALIRRMTTGVNERGEADPARTPAQLETLLKASVRQEFQ